MPMTEEEVRHLAICKAKCVFAGIIFGQSILQERLASNIVAPVNVTGLVKKEELKVPNSELAIHVGAAGKELIAWSITEDGQKAHIVYDDDGGCCGFTHGLPSELMTPTLIEVTKAVLRLK